MAKYLVSLDMEQNEIQNVVMQVLATPPQTPAEGQFYYNSVQKKAYQFNGTAWKALGVSAISELEADSDLDMQGSKVVGLGTPSVNTDAATKGYVDTKISDMGTVFDLKGAVDLKEADPEDASKTALPLTGNKKGDVWCVLEDNTEYFWKSDSTSGTIEDYEMYGKDVDISGYATLESPAFTGTPTVNGSAIATADDVDEAVSGLVKKATGTIGTAATSAVVAYTGTLIAAYALMNGNIVLTDVAVTSTTVTFNVAASPEAAVTCVVIYA